MTSVAAPVSRIPAAALIGLSGRRRRSTELARGLDQTVCDIDLSRSLFRNGPHALRQALGCDLVWMVLAHHLAVGALNLALSRLGRHPERGVGVLETLRGRRVTRERRTTCRAS